MFIVGAVLQAAAYSLGQMTAGRLVVGFGVGSAAMIVPVRFQMQLLWKENNTKVA